MKIWPLSVIRESPLMPAAYAWELARFHSVVPSESAFYACFNVARQTNPVPMQGLVIVESINAPHRFMYTEYPTFDEFVRLERVAAVQGVDGCMCMVMDALH